MKKTNHLYLMLGLCLFLMACSQSKVIKKIGFFDDKRVIKISLEYAKKPTNAQQAKFKQATQFIDNYLNSERFKNTVLNGPRKLNFIKANEAATQACNELGRATYTYNTVKGTCFNNQEIYQLIKSAEWKLKFMIKPSWGLFGCKRILNNVIGALEGDVIVTSECHFNAMSVELLAGFLMHEYMHVIGFKHPYQPSPNRKNTVPYFIGDHAFEAFIQIRN